MRQQFYLMIRRMISKPFTSKTVPLQILTVLSFVWSTAFSLFVWGIGSGMAFGWTSMVIGHPAIIFACYYTFKQFQRKTLSHKFGTYP